MQGCSIQRFFHCYFAREQLLPGGWESVAKVPEWQKVQGFEALSCMVNDVRQLLCHGLASHWCHSISHDSDSFAVIKTAVFLKLGNDGNDCTKTNTVVPKSGKKQQTKDLVYYRLDILYCCVVLHTNAALLYNLTNIRVVLSPVFVWRQNYWDTAAWRGKQQKNDLTETRNNLVNFTV